MYSLAISTRSRLALALGPLVLTFFFASCDRKPASAARTKVVVGYLPIAAGLPLFVAAEKGYFSEAGFDAELVRFASSNELGTAAAAGQIDALMPFALNAAFDISTVTKKRDQLFGYNIYSDQKPHVVDYLVARKGTNIKTLADLRGRRVAGFPGSVTRIFVENILRKSGVEPKDFTYVEMGPKDWLAALQSGSIDAASVMEPQASLIISSGIATVVVEGFFAKLKPDVPLSGNWLAARFVETQPLATQKAFVSAFDKAIDYIRSNPDDAKKYYMKYVGVDAAALPGIQLNDWRKLDEFKASDVQEFADLLIQEKAIQQGVDIKQYLWSSQR